MTAPLSTENDLIDERVPRRVVAAAVKLKDGRIICGVRHFDQLMRTWLPQNGEEAHDVLMHHEQGFIDNKYRFLNRSEAWVVAVAQGQLLPNFCGIEGCLHSEDLW